MRYNVIRTDMADSQIRSIILYIAEKSGNDADRVVKQNKERCGHFGGGTDRRCPAASLIIGHLSPRSVIRISVKDDQIDREKWSAYLRIYRFCL